MELFKFYSEPTKKEGELVFKIEPGKELSEQLSKDWVQKLNEEVTQSFVEIMSKKENEVDSNYVNLMRTNANARVNGNSIEFKVDSFQRDGLDNIVANFNEAQLEVYDALTNKLTQKMADMFGEYMDTVIAISESKQEV